MMLLVTVYLVVPVYLTGQVLRKDTYRMAPQADESPILLGNGVVELLLNGQRVLAGTGFGLNITMNDGLSWQRLTAGEYGGKGGISAMGFMDDSTMWIAASYDTLTDDSGNLPAGGGLSYSRDFGTTWTHVRQPVDSREETGYKPTTTVIQNITFDIAFLDSTIWITSFGGGLRRSDDMGRTWEVVTTDGLPFSALDYLNHRAFSVMTENDNIWVGTAEGISKSSDGGETWQRFTSDNQAFPVSGNFVVALAHQSHNGNIWAATIETDTSEVRAVSMSADGGAGWQVMLEGIFAHNIAFDDSIVYVAADEGLFISRDQGENWYRLPPVRDTQTGEEILTDVYYSARVGSSGDRKLLWAGSADGLAVTGDNGNTWTVHRSFQSTRSDDTPEAYAYPSPFSPSRDNYIRFQYDITGPGEVEIDIYDFAMDRVTTIREYESSPAGTSPDRSAKWDGRNDAGDVVASGVYLFRVEIEGTVSWGKLVVVN